MDATTFFLTYPQSDFTHEQVYGFLQSIKPVVWARVAIESHESGDPHCHAVVRFGARVKTRSDNRVFDFLGRHPNIQVPRRIKDVLEYCAKDGNFRDFGAVPGAKSVHAELVEAASRKDRDALDGCALSNRVSKAWADHIWSRHSGLSSNTILEPGPGTMCLQLQGLQFSGGAIAVVGPSGCGKTTWAKTVAPKPALWIRHIDDLKKLTLEHKSLIFDDMDFLHWPRTSQIHLVDIYDMSSINVKHTTVSIPAGMPRIFTGNVMMFVDDPAINRRLEKVFIHSYAL